MNKFCSFTLFINCLLTSVSINAQGTLISNFGSNPGNLNAYEYIPADMPSYAPLVVVMHGCTQDATEYSNSTGWNDLAERHKFYVVYAEQKTANNSSSCFNYWESGDNSRGQGEARSIKQMVDYMKSSYSIDSSRVFATGLSAGGAMTVVMLSAYPEVFAAGAEMAGLPYKVANNSTEVLIAAIGGVSKSPQQWGDLVRAQYPNYTGSYPRLGVYHGTSDIVINDKNADETIKQFTNLHGTDQSADYYDPAFNGHSNIKYRQYFDADSNIVMEYYAFDGMAHGIAVDPGSCYEQGGSTIGVSFDFDFYSSFWAAKFFGILQPPFSISGTSEVTFEEQGVTFSVPGNAGASYSWEVPTGATIASGQGTNSITVNWGDSSGIVSVIETLSNGCVNPIVQKEVTIAVTTNIETYRNEHDQLFIEQQENGIKFMVNSVRTQGFNACLFDLSGRIVWRKNNLRTNQYNLVSVELSPGIYILDCTIPDNKLQKKFVLGE